MMTNDVQNTEQWLSNFITTYQTLTKDNLYLLKNIYHQDIYFQDPFHHVQYLNKLTEYFSSLYKNLQSCQFDITDSFLYEDQAALYWKMTYQHSALNNGKDIIVEGHSHLKRQDNKVIYHRDYFDAGAMIYQHVPIVGFVIKHINKKIQS